MKVRKGFVSNSSSSSFVCDITGSVESGMDCGLSDFEMVGCAGGHTFMYEGFKDVEAWIEAGQIDDTDEDEDFEEGLLPKSLCPICNGSAKTQIATRIADEMKRLGVSLNDIKAVSK